MGKAYTPDSFEVYAWFYKTSQEFRVYEKISVNKILL